MSLASHITLYSDSKSAISVVHNLVQHDRIKHVRTDRNFIKNEIEHETIVLSYTPSHKKQMCSLKHSKNQVLIILCPSWEWLISIHQLEGECWKVKAVSHN